MCSQGRTKTKMQNSAYETCRGVPVYSYFSQERQIYMWNVQGCPLSPTTKGQPRVWNVQCCFPIFCSGHPNFAPFRIYNEGGLNRFFALSASFPFGSLSCIALSMLCLFLSKPSDPESPPPFDSLEVISAKILHSTGIVTAKVWRLSWFWNGQKTVLLNDRHCVTR